MDLKKFLKKRNNRIMLVILIIGIVIIAISGSIPSGKKAEEISETVTDVQGEEERLSEILSQIGGAGRVSVMISYASTAEKELAGESEGRTYISGGDVVVKKETYPAVRGVIVIADGAGNPEVRQKIMEAAVAVTGAAANHVCVYSRGQ
ncbi:MAG: hypothetical protein J1G06_02365 [Oscillospiraceae bacterium]|nr:hypothetical protein [Oscillospiraceae bacterium]